MTAGPDAPAAPASPARAPGTTSLVTAPGAARPVTPLGIAAARLADLVRRCDDLASSPGGSTAVSTGLPAVLRDELREVHRLVAGLDPYLEKHTSPESPALAALAAATAAHDWRAHPGGPGGPGGPGDDEQGEQLPQDDRPSRPGAPSPLEQEMLSGHVEGELLKTLVHATRAEAVLEIGLFTGYSALALAEALPDHGRVVALEIDPEVARFARDQLDRSPAGAKVDIRVGPASDTLTSLAAHGERFDLVFVDADKGGYLAYLDAVLGGAPAPSSERPSPPPRPGLLTEHALVCVDNTLMQGQPWTQGGTRAGPTGRAVAEFNRAVAADPRVAQVVLPLRDGVTLIRRVEDANRLTGPGGPLAHADTSSTPLEET